MSTFIYNLVFPTFVNQVNLNGYLFTRVPEYVDRVRLLQHHIEHFHEFHVERNFGENAITAEVHPPDAEPSVCLKWGKVHATHLDDILLILSLFTMRHVWADEGGYPIADHRCYAYGWALGQGIYIVGTTDRGMRGDIGFEPGINKVLKRIEDPAWQDQYRGGYYLLLANQAFRRQTIETTFSLCWTIWEHLFTLHNDYWLDSRNIRQLSSKEKVAFLLHQYSIHKHAYGSFDKKEIESLVQVRNRLTHFGMFPEGEQEELIWNVRKFIKWTEYLIAKTLGLYETESFDTVEEFDTAMQEKISSQTAS